MHPPPPISVLIILGFTAAGALVSPFLMRRWPFGPWVKVACWIYAFSGLAHIALSLALSHYTLPWARYWALYTIQMILLGVALGILVLFFLSGEAFKALRRGHPKV